MSAFGVRADIFGGQSGHSTHATIFGSGAKEWLFGSTIGHKNDFVLSARQTTPHRSVISAILPPLCLYAGLRRANERCNYAREREVSGCRIRQIGPRMAVVCRFGIAIKTPIRLGTLTVRPPPLKVTAVCASMLTPVFSRRTADPFRSIRAMVGPISAGRSFRD